MKRLTSLLLVLLLLSGCSGRQQSSKKTDIAATTWPVYCFCTALCEGTDLQIGRVITESVSCLHNYTLSVSQMKTIESANVLVLSGAGLEDFMEDAFASAGTIIDASEGIDLLPGEDGEPDAHIWLAPDNARQMVDHIAEALCSIYPDWAETIQTNQTRYAQQLKELQTYGTQTLSDLPCRELVTFHDGFAYFAQAFDLTILAAIEEESGSEASAADLKEIIALVQEQQLPAVFTEVNGSEAAASIIARETGCKVYALSLIMDGTDYLEAMRQNIDAIKEALS